MSDLSEQTERAEAAEERSQALEVEAAAREVRWESVRAAFQSSSALWAGAVVLVAAMGFGAMGMQTFVTIQKLPEAVRANTASIETQAARSDVERAELDRQHTLRMNATDSLVEEVVRTQKYLICRDDPTLTEAECARIIFR